MIDSSQGWSIARIVSSVTPRAASKPTLIASLWPASSLDLHEAGVADLARQLDLEPVGRIVPADIGVELGLRPFGEGGAEFALRRRDALGAVDLGEAAGQHRLGLVIQRAQQLRLPAVPDARARRRGCRRWSGSSSSFICSTDCTTAAKFSMVWRSERSRDCATVDMVRCCSISQATSSVSAAAEAEPRAQPPRHLGAGDRVILGPALGDVVQQHGDVDHRADARDGSCASGRWRRANSSLPPRSMSCRKPTQRIRCSSTV